MLALQAVWCIGIGCVLVDGVAWRGAWYVCVQAMNAEAGVMDWMFKNRKGSGRETGKK